MTTPTKPALFRVRVHLMNSVPQIWRLIEIDADMRLDQVHTALQEVMGWEDAHLHNFDDHHPYNRRGSGLADPPRSWGPAFLREEDDNLLAEEGCALREVLTEDNPLFYTYDLGDGWLHCLSLIEILSKTPTDKPVTVIRGERRCPLEDSGGIGGYEELLQVIADPAHEYHHDQAEWVTEITGLPASLFDPAAFDAAAVNRQLQKILPGPRKRVRP